MAKGTEYIVQRGMYGRRGRVGTASSLDKAKALILKDGELLTKYDVIRITPKGTQTRIGTYQNKFSNYFRTKLKVVVAR